MNSSKLLARPIFVKISPGIIYMQNIAGFVLLRIEFVAKFTIGKIGGMGVQPILAMLRFSEHLSFRNPYSKVKVAI